MNNQQFSSPHRSALGAAIGVFIGVTPIMPLQTPLALILAWITGANRNLAVLAVWINNPMTVVPLYSAAYMLGCLILSRPFSSVNFAVLANSELSLTEQLTCLWTISRGILGPVVTGSIFLGTLGALITYIVIYAVWIWRIPRARFLPKNKND